MKQMVATEQIAGILSEQQIIDIIRQNSKPLYEHRIGGLIRPSQGSSAGYSFDGLVFISDDNTPITTQTDFIKLVLKLVPKTSASYSSRLLTPAFTRCSSVLTPDSDNVLLNEFMGSHFSFYSQDETHVRIYAVAMQYNQTTNTFSNKQSITTDLSNLSFWSLTDIVREI